MSKKKKKSRYSKAEKLVAFRQFFVDKQLPFTPSEFTKGGMLGKYNPALKSVRMAKQVKELLVDLEADGYIESDKIGNAQYYWCFLSNVSSKKKRKLSQLQGIKEENVKKKRKIDNEIAELESVREVVHTGGRKRKDMVNRKKELKRNISQYNQDLLGFRDRDPEYVSKLESQMTKTIAGAERWTDNVYAVENVLVKKMNRPRDMVKNILEMDDSFDDAVDDLVEKFKKMGGVLPESNTVVPPPPPASSKKKKKKKPKKGSTKKKTTKKKKKKK